MVNKALGPSNIGAMLMALSSGILMGTIGSLAQASQLDATTITFYRLLFGALCLIGYMFSTGKRAQLLHRPSKRNLINGAMLAGFMVFYVQSIAYINMANAVMLIYLAPLLSAVLAHFLYHEHLTRLNLLAILIALVGVFAILPGLASLSGNEQDLKGYGFALFALLSYSGFMLLNRKPANDSPYQSTLVQLLFGACCLLPLSMIAPVFPEVQQWGWLLLIGIFPGFLAILLAVKALRQLPAATFGTLAYIEPVTVVILGWTLFSQHLSSTQLMGCALIMAAGLIQTRQNKRQKVTPDETIKPVST